MCFEEIYKMNTNKHHDTLLSMLDGNVVDYIGLAGILIHESINSPKQESTIVLSNGNNTKPKESICTVFQQHKIPYQRIGKQPELGIGDIMFEYLEETHSIEIYDYAIVHFIEEHTLTPNHHMVLCVVDNSLKSIQIPSIS